MKRIYTLLIVIAIFLTIIIFSLNNNKYFTLKNNKINYEEMYTEISNAIRTNSNFYLTSYYAQEFYIEYIDGELNKLDIEFSTLEENNLIQVYNLSNFTNKGKNQIRISNRSIMKMEDSIQNNLILKEILKSVDSLINNGSLILGNRNYNNFSIEYLSNYTDSLDNSNIDFILYKGKLISYLDFTFELKNINSKVFILKVNNLRIYGNYFKLTEPQFIAVIIEE